MPLWPGTRQSTGIPGAWCAAWSTRSTASSLATTARGSIRAIHTPVYTARRAQPRVRVTLDRDLPAMQRAIDAVPIPRRAQPAAGTDKHMVIWQPSTDTMWEFWRMRRLPRPLARGRRRRDAPRLDQPRLLHPRLLARRAALVGSHRYRPAPARRPDDDSRAPRGHIDHALAMGFPTLAGCVVAAGDPRRRHQHGRTRFPRVPGCG